MWSMLFGLLMWDCLFADVPDTLRTQFQLAPLDLSTSHFYEVPPSFPPPAVLPKGALGMPHTSSVQVCCATQLSGRSCN